MRIIISSPGAIEDPAGAANPSAPFRQGYELRCCLWDLDGRIIKLGQATGFLDNLED